MTWMSALCMAAVLVTAVQVVGRDVHQVSSVSHSTTFASMRHELASLNSELDHAFLGNDECDTCGQGGCDCYCDVGCGGWYGGAELALLRPHTGTGGRQQTGGNPSPLGNTPSFDFQASPRIFLGYRNCKGRSVRIRYWDFNKNSNIINPDLGSSAVLQTTQLSVEATTLDVDVTQLICWGSLQMNFVGGVRYGHSEVTDSGVLVTGGVVRGDILRVESFDGWGPTVAMEARKPISCGPLAAVANLRGSMLFGDRRVLERLQSDVELGKDRNTPEGIFESQLGVEYSRCCGAGILTARALLEAQYWHITAPGSGGTGGGDLGFFGATFGVEYSR